MRQLLKDYIEIPVQNPEIYWNSSIFERRYLRAQEELEARTRCVRKPRTWFQRRNNPIEKYFLRKKLQLDKYTHKPVLHGPRHLAGFGGAGPARFRGPKVKTHQILQSRCKNPLEKRSDLSGRSSWNVFLNVETVFGSTRGQNVRACGARDPKKQHQSVNKLILSVLMWSRPRLKTRQISPAEDQNPSEKPARFWAFMQHC